MLLVYATDAVNSGHETSDDRVVLRKIGGLPILVETGTLTTRIKSKHSASFKCFALGLDGTRKEEVPLKNNDGAIQIAVDTAKLKNGPALFFELVAE